MISIAYLLLYMAAGMQMIRFLLPRKSPLVRAWLGAALGMLLEMQLPALFAWLFGFTIKAHIAAVAALAAILAGADKLLLLTDQQGLFTADPRTNPQAELIKDVHGIDDALRAIAGDSVSGLGTGGMGTKLQAADVACRAGIDTIIAAGSKPGVIGDVMEGISVGTRFHAQASPLENRKRWIFGAPPAGELTVDEGATAAILERGSSLLPKGIKSVTGNFSRGEVIRIRNLAGRDIAHGVSRYNSDALRRIAGHHSQQIDAILGYEYGPVAVHRDDMIIR